MIQVMITILLYAIYWYIIGYILFLIYQLRFGQLKQIDLLNGFKTALFGALWILPIIVWVISDSLNKNKKDHE
jgi:hypothetical protein